MVQSILAMAALAIITVALIGQAMEMRKIRIRTYGEGEVGHQNIFLDKKNVKWYILIGIGMGIAYTAQLV